MTRRHSYRARASLEHLLLWTSTRALRFSCEVALTLLFEAKNTGIVIRSGTQWWTMGLAICESWVQAPAPTRRNETLKFFQKSACCSSWDWICAIQARLVIVRPWLAECWVQGQNRAFLHLFNLKMDCLKVPTWLLPCEFRNWLTPAHVPRRWATQGKLL